MVFAFILVGAIGGVLGGMGMGGGTLLIPALTLIFNFNQQIAQGINLISFSLMSILAITIHYKNGLINVKNALNFGIFATIFACLGSFLAGKMSSMFLTKAYGVMLLVTAIYLAINELYGCFIKSSQGEKAEVKFHKSKKMIIKSKKD